jgi:hypothetical protein
MRRRLLLPVLTLALGLGVGLLAVESVLRLVGFSSPPTSRRDDFCGTIRRPGVEYYQSQEGGAWVRVNSAGFRDEEWTPAKPPETYRIAVLGDSYVEAVQVSLGERFTEVLERELDRSEAIGGKRLEVMSFGLSGFGTAQELMCLRHHVWQYSPDLVLLAVTTGNDVRNNSRALQNDDGRPYFEYEGGTLTLDDSFRQSLAHERSWVEDAAIAVVERSRAAQFAHRAWRNSASAAQRAATREAAQAGRTGDEPGLDSWIYTPPADPVRDDAWRVTEGLFAQMSREVAARARFVLVTLSNGVQVHPDPAVRQAFMQRMGASDLFYPERRIAAAGRRDGYAVVNLAPILLDRADRTGAFFHGFGRRLGSGHWNQDGHREAGRSLAAQIRTLLAEAGMPATARSDSDGGTQ